MGQRGRRAVRMRTTRVSRVRAAQRPMESTTPIAYRACDCTEINSDSGKANVLKGGGGRWTLGELIHANRRPPQLSAACGVRRAWRCRHQTPTQLAAPPRNTHRRARAVDSKLLHKASITFSCHGRGALGINNGAVVALVL